MMVEVLTKIFHVFPSRQKLTLLWTAVWWILTASLLLLFGIRELPFVSSFESAYPITFEPT